MASLRAKRIIVRNSTICGPSNHFLASSVLSRNVFYANQATVSLIQPSLMAIALTWASMALSSLLQYCAICATSYASLNFAYPCQAHLDCQVCLTPEGFYGVAPTTQGALLFLAMVGALEILTSTILSRRVGPTRLASPTFLPLWRALSVFPFSPHWWWCLLRFARRRSRQTLVKEKGKRQHNCRSNKKEKSKPMTRRPINLKSRLKCFYILLCCSFKNNEYRSCFRFCMLLLLPWADVESSSLAPKGRKGPDTPVEDNWDRHSCHE